MLKSQLIDTRAKCELLEQSLRVLAQENLELESKKLRHHLNNTSSVPSPSSAKTASMEDEIGTEAGNPSCSIVESDNSEFEEFFDIGNNLILDF